MTVVDLAPAKPQIAYPTAAGAGTRPPIAAKRAASPCGRRNIRPMRPQISATTPQMKKPWP